MKVFASDRFVLPLPEGHRFPMQKYALLRQLIERESPQVQVDIAPAATPGELALAHDPSYIAAVLEGSLSVASQREIGFPWSPAMAERSVRSVGATIAAARTALQEGVSMNLAGGTHHAYRDKGSGYCVFNDVAVAARLMQAERARISRHPLKIIVIDLDVHQGNGTAAIFQGDASVFTLSLHGQNNFPFRKEKSDWDVELPDGCDDSMYLSALDVALEQVQNCLSIDHSGTDAYMAFYLAGADPHENDRLGKLGITDEGLRLRDERVLSWLHQRRIPVAISMAGGYGRDIEHMVQLQHNTVTEAYLSWQRWQ